MSMSNAAGTLRELVIMRHALVRDRRRSLGLSQRRLAVLANCSLGTIQNVEAGLRCHAITLQKIEDALADLEAAA